MIDNLHIVAFTGHRTYKGKADEELRRTISKLYDEGCRIFRIGMAEGFDLSAGEAVIELMEHCNDIILEAYIPWMTFYERFTYADRRRYYNILSHASVVHYVGTAYHKTIFHQRNDMLVEGAHYIVAWWDGRSSGTSYTVSRAKSAGAHIINLYPTAQLSLGI